MQMAWQQGARSEEASHALLPAVLLKAPDPMEQIALARQVSTSFLHQGAERLMLHTSALHKLWHSCVMCPAQVRHTPGLMQKDIKLMPVNLLPT